MSHSSTSLFSGKIYLNGEIVRLLLRRLSIKQRDAAKALSVSPPQLVQILNQKYPIKPDRLITLSAFLNTNPAQLIRSESANGN